LLISGYYSSKQKKAQKLLLLMYANQTDERALEERIHTIKETIKSKQKVAPLFAIGVLASRNVCSYQQGLFCYLFCVNTNLNNVNDG
jgi:hypothetical protein